MAVDYAGNAGSAAGAVQAGIPPSQTVGGTAAMLAGSNALMGSFYGRGQVAGIGKKVAGWGKQFAKMTPAALVGGAIAAPAQYAADSAVEKYENDKKFNPGHFAEQIVPAAATSYLTAGIAGNIIENASKLGKGELSTGQFMKETVTPKSIHKGFSREVSNVKNSFSTAKGLHGGGRFGNLFKGIVGGTLLGADLIAPGSYLKKLWNKDDSKDKTKGKKMEKTASMFSTFNNARKAVKKSKNLLKDQANSPKHRPDLEKGLKKDIEKNKKVMHGQVAKGVGGVAVAGYIGKSTADAVEDKARQAKQNLGHRGAEYGGLII